MTTLRRILGIPYAYHEWKGNRTFNVCPSCQEWIECVEVKDFESFTGIEYSNHYLTQHATDEGMVLIDGEWFEEDKD